MAGQTRAYTIKLVRDRIATIEEPVGEFGFTACDSPEQHLKLLRQKLVEEVGEYLLADRPAERREELADIVEAVRALAVIDCEYSEDPTIAMAMLQTDVIAKRHARGGFLNGTVMIGEYR